MKSCAEKSVLAVIAPMSGVEYTPDGMLGVAVLNGEVETQNECPMASEGPSVPSSVASEAVTLCAGSVVTDANTGVGPDMSERLFIR